MSLATPSRMTIKLSPSLDRDISAYALAVTAAGIGALAMARPAQGQIVYTPAHDVLEAGSSVSIDFNHDGIRDFTIIDKITTGGATVSRGSLIAIPGARPYGGVARRYYNAAGAFPAGQKIGASRSFASNSDLMGSAYLFLDYYFGSWMPSATNRYLGVRFTLKGKPHYGWIRLNTTWREGKQGIRALISGYAYETNPGAEIAAGDEGGVQNSDSPADSAGRSSTGNRASSLGALALGAAVSPSLVRGK